MVEEQKDHIIADVNPMSQGMRLSSGKMSVLIAKNAHYPYKVTKAYTNSVNNQNRLRLQLY